MSVLYLHRKSLSQNSWHPKQGPNRSKDALGRSDDMVLAMGIKEDNRGWSMKGKTLKCLHGMETAFFLYRWLHGPYMSPEAHKIH